MCPESKGQCSFPKTSNRLRYSDDVVSFSIGTAEVARLLHVKQLRFREVGGIGGRFHSSYIVFQVSKLVMYYLTPRTGCILAVIQW